MKSHSELRSHHCMLHCCTCFVLKLKMQVKNKTSTSSLLFQLRYLSIKTSSTDQTSEPYRVTSPPLCGDAVMILSEQLSSLWFLRSPGTPLTLMG